MTVSKQALRVYATLQSLKGHSEEDVIDALLPFTMPVLEVLNGKPFTPELLVAGLKALYGWSLSTDVAEVFQKRLSAKGYLTKPEPKAARILLVSVPESELQGPSTYSSEVGEIVRAFLDFSSRLNDLLHSTRTEAEALDLLVRFLITLDVGSAASTRKGLEVPELLRGLQGEETAVHPDDRYLCARFVDHVSRTDAGMFDKLVKLASVGMLTEVVQDFVEPDGEQQSSLTLILDAPVALALVGVSGKQAQRDVQLTIDAARSIGCSVCVFQESCDEMSRILKSVLVTPRANRFGPTHSALVRNEVREDFVQAVQRNPERTLNDVGITVRQMALDTHPSLEKFFPQAIYDKFQQDIHWKQNYPDAIRHDAIAMALTCRLRERQREADVLQNRYVFVTNNGAFSRLSHAFSIENGFLQERHCPPVVPLSMVATAVWLRTGFGATNDIPMAHLLAYCERVLNVRVEVVEQARRVLREITPESEAQFDLLLQDARSVTRLMDMTLGDEDRVSEATVPALLEEMRRATAAEVREEYERQLADQKRLYRDTQRKASEAHAEREAAQQNVIEGLETRLRTMEAASAEARRIEDVELLEALADTNKEVEWVRRGVITLAALLSAFLLANEVFAWVDIQRDFRWLAWAGVAVGLVAMLQQFFRWPPWGIGDLLNLLGRRRLRRRAERRGLVRLLATMEERWDFGRGSLHDR